MFPQSALRGGILILRKVTVDMANKVFRINVTENNYINLHIYLTN